MSATKYRTYIFLDPSMSSVGKDPRGENLYACAKCSGFHRRFENCSQQDTGDPWNHPQDGNPE